MIDQLYADDRPIKTIEEDKLGFSEPAARIATCILDFASPEGFVFGLEGEWGTGKSSFLNLIAAKLRKSTPAPEIVHFSPWLISSRDGLLAQLFSEIGRSADIIQNEQSEPKKRWFGRKAKGQVKNVKSLIDQYSGSLVILGNLSRLAGLAGVPLAGELGRKAVDVGKTTQSFTATEPLEKQKDAIKLALRSLPRKIVVFVDDLDRLEPKEVGEVVRLVRAVGDFPNIVYVLSYSRKILTRNLAKAFNLKKQDPYIDKIVQVTFQVPKPEDFTLRNLFREKLSEIFPNSFEQDDISNNNPALKRLTAAIDSQGSRTLKSPRDVARVLNAMRLYGGASTDQTDLGDMVWLQMIRLRNPNLYNYLESYMATVGAIVNANGHIDANVNKRKGEKLVRILREETGHKDNDLMMYEFTDIIPGLNKNFENNEQSWNAYHNLSIQSLSSFIEDRRLGSPFHYRYYFAFSKPDRAILDDEFKEWLEMCEASLNDARAHLEHASSQVAAGSTYKVDLYLDRLETVDFKSLTDTQKTNICYALVSIMDTAAVRRGLGIWGYNPLWNTGERVFYKAITDLPDTIRSNLIQEIFRCGEAISWLSVLIRSEIFSHGRYGDRKEREELWNFSEAELDVALQAFIENLNDRGVAEAIRHPDFLNLLYAWAQGVPDGWEEVKSWLASFIESDEGLLDVLLEMRGQTTSSSEGVYYTLRKDDNVKHFFDYEATRVRVKGLQSHESDHIKTKADKIMAAFEKGDASRF